MASAVVQTENLVKDFKGQRALDGLSLEIPQGITFGLLGPNGSGKTTLIRILVGVVKPTSGLAEVLGRKAASRDNSAEIGYMSQLPALYQDLSVEENLEFFAKIFGLVDRAKRKERVGGVLGLVELTHKRRTLVSALSGGMKQRVSLGCALIHSPTLLFLDEPTVGVDPALRMVFWDHFKRLNEQGVSIVVSSHVMDEAERCDKLGLLRDGKLLASGTLDQILTLTGETKLEQAFLSLEQATVELEVGDPV